MNKKLFIFNILVIVLLLLSTTVIAQDIAVKVIKPEISNLSLAAKISGSILPYRNANLPAKSSSTVSDIKVEVGQYVEAGEALIVFDQEDIKVQVKQAEAALERAKASLMLVKKGATQEQIESAEAGAEQAEAALKQAKAAYEKAKNGATEEEISRVEATYEQAVVSYEGARSNLEVVEDIYKNKNVLKQQLINAEAAVETTEKQLETAQERLSQSKLTLEQAENNYQQAKNNLEQAENEYERINKLYKENVVAKKQYDMVYNQLENARTAVKNMQTAIENAKYTIENTKIAKEQAEVSYQSAKENYIIAKDSFENPSQLKQQLYATRTQLKVSEANKKIAAANLTQVKNGAREEDLMMSKAGVKQAEASLKRARANLAQLKKGAREEEVITAEAGVKQAEASLAAVRLRLDDTIIRSPFSGIVSRINVNEFEMVAPGTPVVSVIDIVKVYARAEVTGQLLSYIKKGDKVEISVKALPANKFTGNVEIISPSSDPQSQAYPVKVILENPDEIVKPGMFADIIFTKEKADNALLIPLEAVINLEDNDPYVYVVKDNKAVKTSVETGITNDKQIQIINGLNKDSQVIYKGQSLVKPGQGVEVVE